MSILQEADEIIHGERQGTYGHPRDSFTAIANLWTVYLGRQDDPLKPEDVAVMMTLFKIARHQIGGYNRDTVVDMAGYVGTIERVREPVVPDEIECSVCHRRYSLRGGHIC